MFDSVQNTGDFLSPHWLSEVFPNRLKDLHADWAERHAHGKADPWHGLIGAAAPFAKAKGQLTEASNGRAADANRQLHEVLLGAAGYEVSREETPHTAGRARSRRAARRPLLDRDRRGAART